MSVYDSGACKAGVEPTYTGTSTPHYPLCALANS